MHLKRPDEDGNGITFCRSELAHIFTDIPNTNRDSCGQKKGERRFSNILMSTKVIIHPGHGQFEGLVKNQLDC